VRTTTSAMRLSLAILGAVATTSVGAGAAQAAKRNPLAGQPAIRNKIELRKLRFEITPGFVAAINQDYRQAFGPGLTLRFHITDWLSVGLQGAYLFNANTPLENQITARLPTNDASYTAPNTTLSQHNQRVLNLQAVGSVFLSLTPWAGKFSLFSAGFASYDFFIDLGAGIIYYTQNGCCTVVPQAPGALPDPNLQDSSIYAGVKAAGQFGVGAHIYFLDFIGLTLELRDYFGKANPGGLDTNGDRLLNGDDENMQNNIFFGIGLTFMLPPRAKITR